MTGRKMRVELFDGEGNKYTIAFEGHVTREKAVRLLDLVELLGGMPNNENSASQEINPPNGVTSKFDRVAAAVQRHLPLVWFSSRELQSVYEREFKDPLTLSTAATYLSRLVTRGLLVKTGPSNSLKYRIAQGLPQEQIKQTPKA